MHDSCPPPIAHDEGGKKQRVPGPPIPSGAFQLPPLAGNDFFRVRPRPRVKPDNELRPMFPPEDDGTPSLGPSLLRSRLIRREFPWSSINYVVRPGSTTSWLDWVEDFFKHNKEGAEILAAVGIKDAVLMSTRLQVPKRFGDLDALVQRWNTVTHTFITSWGEFTPTLEDVSVLAKLPCFGSCNFTACDFEQSTLDIINALRASWTETTHYGSNLESRPPGKTCKATHAAWVRYFFGILEPPPEGQPEGERHFTKGPAYRSDLEVPALIAFWLDRFVFPGPSSESISPGIFVLAALLSEGVRLPLAPLFLGGLYARLDQIQAQLEISFGRYGVNSFIDHFFPTCIFV